MSIDIAAEVKFSHVAEGEYLVRLQDADQTIIGKVIRDGAGWIPQYLDGYFENHTTFATRYMAARPLLEAYELANGLRDSEGRRVGRDPETKGYWVVLSPIGTKQSPRWTDKADAIAHLASLNSLTVFKLVTEHTDGPRVRHFASFEQAFEAGQATDPEKDGSLMPNLSEAVAAKFGGTDEEYQQGLFWLRSNRYAAIYRKELTGATAEAYRQFFEFVEIGRQAALNDEQAAPALNAKVQAALEGRHVGDSFNARIMNAFSKGYQSVRDQQAAQVLSDPQATTDELVDASRADQDRAITEMLANHGLKAEGFDLVPASDQRRCIENGDHLASSRHTRDECTGIIDNRPDETPYANDPEPVEITPVLVWSDGTVTGGIQELTDRLTGQAYGHETDEFALYVTQGGALHLASTRQLSQTTDDDLWIHEVYGVYAGDATEPVLTINLRIDGRA